MRSAIVSSLFLIISLPQFAQLPYGQAPATYPFIASEYNIIEYNGNVEGYNALYSKLTKIALKGEGKVSIVHIGDSHIQADFLSGEFRTHLQTYFRGSMGGRGFIFPYKTAKTNNPQNFRVRTKGQWEACRCVELNHNCILGLSGISVTSIEPSATLSIAIADDKMPGYDFDKLMVFHETGPEYAKPVILFPNTITSEWYSDAGGYTQFEFADFPDSLVIGFKGDLPNQNRFVLHGLNFDSNDPGIIYHTVGVNGARVESYLTCERFSQHLKTLNPDWVIVALGTNDAYTNTLNPDRFALLVDRFISNIKEAAPNAAIMWALPGDHNMKGRGSNPNLPATIEVIKTCCKKNAVGFWDYHAVMGGAGSISAWRKAGLAHTDNLHYTQKGYEYQADLLFDAFMAGYDEFLTQHP